MIGSHNQSGLWVAALFGSVAVHVGFAAMLLAPWAGFLRPAPPPPPVDLSLVVVPESIAEPDAVATDIDDPDVADTPAEPAQEVPPVDTQPEEVPPAEPEEVDPVEPESAEPVEPEAPVAPEPPVAAEPPTVPAAIAAAPATPAVPVAPIAPATPSTPATVVSAAPVAASPLRPEEGTPGSGSAPVAAAPVSPVIPVGNPAVISTAAPAAPRVIAALPPIAPPPPSRPAAAQPAPGGGGGGGAETPAGELVRRIRGELAAPCLVALPRQAADGTLSLDYIAANEADMNAFAERLMTGAANRPAERRILVDPRQCPALNYVRTSTRYPGSPIGLGLLRTSVPSGENLQGALRNAGGRYVSLVLIDADGVVQDLGGFMSFAGPTVQFDAPVERDGDARDTAQLVLALATDTRPPALDTHIGRLAEDFFPALAQTAGPSTLMALESFTVP